MDPVTNQITLRGSLVSLPTLSHENHGHTFYKFLLEIPRLSGAIDTLPVIAESHILSEIDLSGGELLTVTGQIRSHNVREDGVRHLMIFVFAQNIRSETSAPLNEATLEGTLCREPNFRRTPLGREICDVMLAVPRAFSRADYIPCILWGMTAKEVALCHTRDRIRIYGRMQSRIYTKLTEAGAQEHTAYELSALSAEILTDPF